MALSLSTVMIGSDDPTRLRGFYTELLGEPGWEDGGYTGWQVGASMLMIGPHSEVTGRNAMPGRLILNFETTTFDDEFARIQALGAVVQREPYQPGDEAGDLWLATFEDPDGNFFQIATPMPPQP